MTNPFRCGGPIASSALVAPGDTMLTRFTPQRRFVVEGCQLQRGWEVVSMRRVGFGEIEIGGSVHGLGCRPFTFKPRPDVDLPYLVVPRGDGHIVRLLDSPDVCISEGLEMTVRNTEGEPREFKSWWFGTTETA